MTFEFTPTEDGFRIRDTIENVQTTIDLGRSIEPEPGTTAPFPVPLDTAVTVETGTMAFPEHFGISVHESDTDYRSEGLFIDPQGLPTGTYVLQASYPHFTLYFHVEETAVDGEKTADSTRLSFDSATTVTLGLRSFHQRPAGTVSTTQDPRDLMRAISTFGTALKTHSPERSWPTLRGHPPELAVRGRTTIPDQFQPPDTGITIEVPPEYDQIFTVAPLAYYFGATIEPGGTPRFHAADTAIEFDTTALAQDVNQLLRHSLLLDCVVRTEGIYPLDLYEQQRLDERLSLDASTLYDLPLDERTGRYLDIPFETTTDLIDWPYVADLDPTPLNAEALPYLAYRLATIRSPSDGRTRQQDTASDAPPASTAGDRAFLPGDQDSRLRRVVPAEFDAVHNLWIGGGVPVDGVKPTLGAYLRSIDSTPKDAVIDQHVVLANEAETADIKEAYEQTRPTTSVTIHDSPTVSDLHDLLTSDIDYLHYRGPIIDDGLTCLDGTLDVRTLPRTGVSAFFLEGASSYEQGLSMVHAGGTAGLVTTTQTPPPPSTGRILGQLLDHGFTLANAAMVLHRLSADTSYLVVGDGDHQVSTAKDLNVLTETHPAPTTDDSTTVRVTGLPSLTHRIGTLQATDGDAANTARIAGSHVIELHRDSVDVFAELGDEPLIADGELYWLDDLTAEEVWRLLR